MNCISLAKWLLVQAQFVQCLVRSLKTGLVEKMPVRASPEFLDEDNPLGMLLVNRVNADALLGIDDGHENIPVPAPIQALESGILRSIAGDGAVFIPMYLWIYFTTKTLIVEWLIRDLTRPGCGRRFRAGIPAG